MERDLVDQIAEAIWQAESERAAGRQRKVTWEEASDREGYIFIAKSVTSLSIIEKIFREHKAMKNALTPSSETKYIYSGEFNETHLAYDDDGYDYCQKVPVSWPTIKNIMTAIRKAAGIEKEDNATI